MEKIPGYDNWKLDNDLDDTEPLAPWDELDDVDTFSDMLEDR